MGQQTHPVAGVLRQRGQQQRGVERCLEPRSAAHPAGCGAAGVEDEQDLAVPLRAPGADHDVAAPSRCPPVDRTRVITADIGAQRVELAALTAHESGNRAIQLAQPGELVRQQPPAGERRQHPDRPRRSAGPLPARETQRTERPDRDARGCPLAAAGRHQRRAQAGVFATADVDPPRPRGGAGGWWPGVSDHRAQRAVAGVGDREGDLGGLAEPGAGGTAALEADRTRRRREAEIDEHANDQHGPDQQHGQPAERHDEHDEGPDRRRNNGPPGQRHLDPESMSGQRGTGTAASTPSSTPSALTPSSSASGRTLTRCRNVGRASALTSSGVT